MKTRLVLLFLATLGLSRSPLVRAEDATRPPAADRSANTDRDASMSRADPDTETPGQFVDDATITAKVKAALFRDGTLHPTEIHVATSHGVVQLSGFVDSREEKSQAEEVAEHVAGVRSVTNELSVK